MEYSRLYLLEGVPLNMNHEHTIDFANAESQFNFFQSYKNTIVYDNDYSWIRDNIIKVNVNIDDIKSCNYIMFNNKSKWYYAFITSKEYVNQNNTQINFVIDVMQTFMFDYTIGETFVEREHQDRYIEIENNKLQPVYSRTRENLERGNEFYLKNKTEMQPKTPEVLATFLQGANRKMYWVTVVAKKSLGKRYNNGNVTETETRATSVNLLSNNVFTYILPVIIDNNDYFGGSPKFYAMEQNPSSIIVQGNAFPLFNLDELTDLSKDINVISMNISEYAPFEYDCIKQDSNYFIYPLNNVPLAKPPYLTAHYSYQTNNNILTYRGTMYFINYATTNNLPIYQISHDLTINKNDLSIENDKNIAYEPKLKTVDYEYLQLEIGDQKTQLSNENFDTNNIEIEYLNTFSAKGSSSFVIMNYERQLRNHDKSIIINNVIHELPLISDEWLNYLRNNKNSLVSGLITGAIGTVGGTLLGLATGGIGLAVAGSTALSYGAQIANQLARYQDMKNKPNEIKNTAFDLTLDVLTKGINLQIKTYGIHNQFLERIFNYFYHYGYLANEFITPNLKSRYYFNYIKTIGCNIQSSIDNEYVTELRNIFDNGITIWHYRDDSTWKGVGEYNYENVETSILEVTSND